MGGVKSDLRLVSIVLAGALIAAAATLLLAWPDRSASAEGAFDFTGITCMDVYFDNEPLLVQKGDPPGPEDDRASKLLSRIEPSAQPDAWDVTSVAYSGPGTLIPTKPPSAENCQVKTDGNNLNPSVPYQIVDIGLRPTAAAGLVQKGQDTNLEWEVCQYEPDLLGGAYVLSKFSIVVTGKTLAKDYGTLTAYLDTQECTETPDIITYQTILVSTTRTATKGEPDPALADDWDGDDCTDWDELDPVAPLGRDPFNPFDCFVGGIAELPGMAGAPLEADGSSGPGTGLLASAIAASVAASALGGLTAATWYVRRGRPR